MVTIYLRTSTGPSNTLKTFRLRQRLVLGALARRSYWPYRSGKQGSWCYNSQRDPIYCRVLRYKSSNGPSGYAESSNKRLGSRECRSWVSSKQSKGKGAEHNATGEEENRQYEPEELWKQITNDFRHYRAQLKQDPSKYKDYINEILKTDPYSALFGLSEARGVWNPWRSIWRANFDHYVHIMRQVNGLQEDKTTSSTTPAEKNPPRTHIVKATPMNSKVTETVKSKEEEPVEEYTIDPITMRKVAQSRSNLATGPIKQQDAPNQIPKPHKPIDGDTTEIPVKKFVPEQPMTDLSEEEIKALAPKAISPPPPSGFATQPWLAQEGFLEDASNTNAVAQPKEARPTKNSSISDPMASFDKRARKLPQYNAEENRSEDIDLLRASDVRAASGHLKKPSLLEEKQHEKNRENRRIELDKNFDQLQNVVDKQLTTAEPFIDKARFSRQCTSHVPEAGEEIDTCSQKQSAPAVVHPNSSSRDTVKDDRTTMSHQNTSQQQLGNAIPIPQALSHEHIQDRESTSLKRDAVGVTVHNQSAESLDLEDFTNKIQTAEKYYAEQQRALLSAENDVKELKKKAADVVLRQEVGDQKAAMEAHEHRPRVSASPENTDTVFERFEPDRPDATRRLMDESKRAQKERDQALVKEIREIYEQRFGKINTEHRQLVEQAPSASNHGSSAKQFEIQVDDIPQSENLSVATTVTPESTELPAQPVNNKRGRPADPMSLRQPSSIESPKRILQTYKVLALDEDKAKVVVGRTTSPLYEPYSTLRSPSSILMHLENPTKYFESMESLERAGYMLVAGTRRTLIYKMITSEQLSTPPVPAEVISETSKPDEGVHKIVAPDMQKLPTITDTPPVPKPSLSQSELSESKPSSLSSPPPSRLVRRQEPVFSGAPNRTGRVLTTRIRESERIVRRRQGQKEDKEAPTPSPVHTEAPPGNNKQGRNATGPVGRLFRGIFPSFKLAVVVTVVVYALGVASEWTAKQAEYMLERKIQEAKAVTENLRRQQERGKEKDKAKRSNGSSIFSTPFFLWIGTLLGMVALFFGCS